MASSSIFTQNKLSVNIVNRTPRYAAVTTIDIHCNVSDEGHLKDRTEAYRAFEAHTIQTYEQTLHFSTEHYRVLVLETVCT